MYVTVSRCVVKQLSNAQFQQFKCAQASWHNARHIRAHKFNYCIDCIPMEYKFMLPVSLAPAKKPACLLYAIMNAVKVKLRLRKSRENSLLECSLSRVDINIAPIASVHSSLLSPGPQAFELHTYMYCMFHALFTHRRLLSE